MTRDELTVEIMEDRGFRKADITRPLELVVEKIKTGEFKYLRMREDRSTVYFETEHTMCAMYEVTWHVEYLEASYNNEIWFPVAKRKCEKSKKRRCVYAD